MGRPAWFLDVKMAAFEMEAASRGGFVALFGKSDDKSTATPTGPQPGAPAPSIALPPAGATVIARDTRVNGELTSSDTIQVDGRVEGKIRSTRHLVIGETGQVHAEVEAEWVSIHGVLRGDCSAANKVDITGTGKVYGNIHAPVIAVAEGAIFKGASVMTGEKKQTRRFEPEKRPSSPAAASAADSQPNH